MKERDFLQLLENVTKWVQLEKRIASLPTEQERGEAFEVFCRAFFLIDPVFQFEKVYRSREIPPSIREQLGYPTLKDIGIDGIAVSLDGKLTAYQAKFRIDRMNTPTLSELSTFFTVSDRADWRITITNALKLPKAINDRINSSRVLSDRLIDLHEQYPDFFDRLRQYIEDQIIAPPKRNTPHKTQLEAIENALLHFKDHDRGQLILPCGTGKTLAAMWIAERLGGKRILVMVPSLSLMNQALRDWASDTSISPFRYLCLCSDTTVDLGEDAPIEHRYEMDIPVTTDASVVTDFLLKEPDVTSVLFSTYQSSEVLKEASKRTKIMFDTAIFDEAHKTTGTKIGTWKLALDNDNVPVKKRLFMTATPRIYAPHIQKKAKDEDVLICSMDDEKFYGKPFYEITFGEAIERGHITDYKIVIICVTDVEVKKIIQQRGKLIFDNKHEWDAKAFAKRVALVKGMKAYGLKKVFTFHGKIKGAKAFTDTNNPYGIDKVFKILEPATYTPETVKFFHVNGEMSSGERKNRLDEFKEAQVSIMSNARCLTEGVNVPAVDTIAFIDPKESLIDIVQATGRAMRKAQWKEKGYIFIPVVIDEEDDPEEIIETSDFKSVWRVLQSMIDQDQRLESLVSNMRVIQGRGEEKTEAWKAAMSEYSEKIEFFNLPFKIHKARFLNSLYTKTLEIVGRSWDFWYGVTLRFKEQNNGDPNAPRILFEGFKLGSWQSSQRQSYKKKLLSADRIERLNQIGFAWDPHDQLFEKGFQKTLRFKEQNNGNPNASKKVIFEGYNLGSWQDTLRRRYKNNKLSKERINRLEEIGFKWKMNYPAAELRGIEKQQGPFDPDAEHRGIP